MHKYFLIISLAFIYVVGYSDNTVDPIQYTRNLLADLIKNSDEQSFKNFREKHENTYLTACNTTINPESLSKIVDPALGISVNELQQMFLLPCGFGGFDTFQAARQIVDEKIKKEFQFDMEALTKLQKNIVRGVGESVSQGNLQRFIGDVFAKYFKELDPKDKRSMLAYYIRNWHEGMDDNDRLRLLLNGAGPYLQKILQLFGDKVSDPRMKEILGGLKTNIKGIEIEERDKLVKRFIDDNGLELIGEPKSLGAASVGETFLLTVKKKESDDPPYQLVLKLLRPGIKERGERELKFLRSVAQNIPGMEETLNGMAAQINTEMDLLSERELVERADKFYNQSGRTNYDENIEAMTVVPGLKSSSDYLPLTLAPGETIERISSGIRACPTCTSEEREVIPFRGLVTLAFLEHLSGKWFEEAIFNSGFYHGDLHGGNVMLKFPTNREILRMIFRSSSSTPNGLLRDVGRETFKKSKMTLIDLGNAATLTSTQREAILNMMFATKTHSVDAFYKGFQKILQKKIGKAKEMLFRRHIKRILENDNYSPGKKISEILGVANDLNLPIPGPIANFSRSELMLENAINGLKGRMKEIGYAPQVADYDVSNAIGEVIDRRLSIPRAVGKLFKGEIYWSNVKAQIRRFLSFTSSKKKECPTSDEQPLGDVNFFRQVKMAEINDQIDRGNDLIKGMNKAKGKIEEKDKKKKKEIKEKIKSYVNKIQKLIKEAKKVKKIIKKIPDQEIESRVKIIRRAIDTILMKVNKFLEENDIKVQETKYY